MSRPGTKFKISDAEVPEGRAESVLVVDDDTDTRNALIGMIMPLGVNPLEATSGRQALNVLKKNDVAAVISDLIMPRMSGMMLLHSMLEQGLHVPFIMTTGYSDKDSAIQALRLGAFDYLEKPVNPEDLRTVLAEALKVSAEQRKLVRILRTHGSAVAGGIDRNAEIQIMKMRTLRFRTGGYDFPVTQGAVSDWETLKALFVQEAEPQLTFCLGALETLAKCGAGDVAAREAAFVLRVVQSVRMASEAVHVNDVAELAWALEKTLGAARLNGAMIVPTHIAAMRRATELLLKKVQALGSAEDTNVRRELDEVAESLSKKEKATPPAA